MSKTIKKTALIQEFFEHSAAHFSNNIAVICDNHALSYQALDEKANQLAHYLLSQGLAEKATIGILLERSISCYIALLATLKIGATYVPIEVDYPDERINHILADLPVHALLTSSSQATRTGLNRPQTIILDAIQESVGAQSAIKPTLTIKLDAVAYVIYTSGSTGKPKGVEVTHSNICHYVSTASSIYAMTSKDKVYQGFSLAFDASLEEIWMAFANGATLVGCADKEIRSGLGLIEFLKKQKVSVFSTVPTLLSTLEGSLPDLRLLIVGGEACTAQLVNRWVRPGLRILNTYGPTEATVVSTFAECEPNQPVTIGQPLPGYSTYIFDEKFQPVADGIEGELYIGGLGIAKGYANSPEMTAIKFIQHPTDKEQRLYRTGDRVFKTANGDLQFTGRMDDQIKLRGFRIELNEIENVLTNFTGINQAVVSLQKLAQPTLVAYISLNRSTEFDLSACKAFLRTQLPDYMIPSLFEPVDAFPLLSSGKVDRKALPIPTQPIETTEYVAPSTPLEKELIAVWEKALQQNGISITADFFYDLGGHSLTAAQVVSLLRKKSAFQNISILDLYQNPSVKQLAQKILQAKANTEKKEPPKPQKPKYRADNLSYYLCGMGQLFGCLLQFGLKTWPVLFIVLGYSLFAGDTLFSLQSLSMLLLLTLVAPILSLTLTISAKWLLLGRVKPGEYPLWGWFYYRWWLVQRLQKVLFSPDKLTGTPLINLYYRLLGTKIGKNCYIGSADIAMYDMVCIGDNSTISADARVLGFVVEDGWLKIGKITIGDNCFIGARAVVSHDTIIENDGVLDDMSMLPTGKKIPQGQFFSGSPACQAIAPLNHITKQKFPTPYANSSKLIHYSLWHYFALVFIMMINTISYAPSFLLLDKFYENAHFLTTLVIGAPLASIIYLSTHYLCIYLCKKLIINKIKPDIYSLQSFYYLRQWTIMKLMDNDAIGVLADSLYFPMLLRRLGAKLGKWVEMGEAPHIIADLVTIEEGGFAASSVAMAWPVIYKGFIAYGRVNIGKKAFVGNLSLLPVGTQMGDGSLLGCISMPPSNNQAAEPNTSWLGSPPMYLPNREIIEGFSDEERFSPSKRLYYQRLIIELVRITLPTTCSFIYFLSLFYTLEYLLSHTTVLTTLVALPVVASGIILSLVGGLIAIKRLILGKITACNKPLWDPFIWKNDIREFTYGYFINQNLTDLILGTPFIAFLFRAMGAKIGKRVFIDTAEFAEFDLISIGSDVCINTESIIQTHLYEDRVFKLATLEIADGCNVGVGSMVLYNTIMEENSSLGNFSLLMKGECLPAYSRWEGSPAQSSLILPKYEESKAEIDNKLSLEYTE